MRREPLNLSRLSEYEVVCPDVETTGLDWRTDRAFGIAVAAFLPRREGIASGYYDVRDQPRVLEVLKNELSKCKRIVNHNVKFDAHILRETGGIELPFGRVECTGVRAALIDEHLPEYNLDYLGRKYVGRGKELDIYGELAALFGGKADKSQIKNLHRAPVETAAKYATPDAEVALLLWAWQEIEIEKQGLEKIWLLEKELTSVLIDVEQGGVRVDEEAAHKKLKAIGPTKEKIIHRLLKLAGPGFDDKLINSPKQIRELFKVCKDGEHWKIGQMIVSATEAGNPSINVDVLRVLADAQRDERAQLIMRAKKLDKAEQFLKGHVLGHVHKGYVYPNYNQTKTERGTGTTTGRFSVEDPALQQIPARDVEMAEIVRSCFVPDKGQKWVCADWKQFEFRWFAHYVNDRSLNDSYRADPETDFHKVTADLTGLPRSPRYAGDANAKQINLGLVFGMGQGKLAAEMGLPHTVEVRPIGGEDREMYVAGPEAEAIFVQYHSAIPGVKALLKQAASIAKSRGYVLTVMGRHLRFPGGKYTHKAGGLVFQGTSADCNKYKMIELYHNGHKQGDYRILLSVHDEFDFSVPMKFNTGGIKKRLETFDGVTCPIECRIPIRSDIGIGQNWYEASK